MTQTVVEKTKLKEFLGDKDELKKLTNFINEIRERFIFDENSFSVKSILDKLCNRKRLQLFSIPIQDLMTNTW